MPDADATYFIVSRISETSARLETETERSSSGYDVPKPFTLDDVRPQPTPDMIAETSEQFAELMRSLSPGVSFLVNTHVAQEVLGW